MERAGQAASQGSIPCRPSNAIKIEEAVRLRLEGRSYKEIIDAVGLSTSTLDRHFHARGLIVPSWTKAGVIGAIKEWVEEYGVPPLASDWKGAADERPNVHVAARLFGSWVNALRAAGYDRSWRTNDSYAGQRAAKELTTCTKGHPLIRRGSWQGKCDTCRMMRQALVCRCCGDFLDGGQVARELCRGKDTNECYQSILAAVGRETDDRVWELAIRTRRNLAALNRVLYEVSGGTNGYHRGIRNRLPTF